VHAAAVSITGSSRSPVRAINGSIMLLIRASSSSPNWIFSARSADTDQFSATAEVPHPPGIIVQIHQIHGSSEEFRRLTNCREIYKRRQAGDGHIDIGIGSKLSLHGGPEHEHLGRSKPDKELCRLRNGFVLSCCHEWHALVNADQPARLHPADSDSKKNRPFSVTAFSNISYLCSQ
jgi:hypothetical protein